ncbi:UTRA domain-containing protein [Alicyclobacillus macrosporangiidus]|uniref:UTRA domain-containing protein n=1 Tax=Alicyclobacillus macrosporangiidus TaxID=392015 RepID=UPI003CCC3EC7
MRVRGVRLVDAKMYLQPHALTSREASLLNVASGTPVFLWERLSYTSGRVPVELARFIIRSDIRRFYIQYSIDR